MVVPVAVASAVDPAMFGGVWVQVPESVSEAVPYGQRAVEVVFELGEERVVRLVARFKDVQVSEEHQRVRRAAGGEGDLAGGQPFSLALCFFRSGVA